MEKRNRVIEIMIASPCCSSHHSQLAHILHSTPTQHNTTHHCCIDSELRFRVTMPTRILLLYLVVILILTQKSPQQAQSLNITSLLSPFPDYSQFSSLLNSISSNLSQRTSLTILALPNTLLSSSESQSHLSPTSPSLIDVLRYHVLLQFLSDDDLHSLPPSGKLVTTLLQTTGRAPSNSGSLNLTRDPTNGVVSIHSPNSNNATVLSLLKTLPYNVTVLSINSLLIPSGLDLMASEARPNLGLNITKALIDGHRFNVAASMLAASGVVSEFESDERGAGITMFVPIDAAFADLPPAVSLQSLPAEKKAVVLKFHVLHAYYPLGSLESVVNPLQPTLATEAVGAGSFTLSISRVNGTVSINTGIVQASITQTVFDQNPLAIFGVSKVLLPKEIFGKNAVVGSKPGSVAPPPEDDPMSPEISPTFDSQPSHLSSPPGFREDMRSGAAAGGSEFKNFVVVVVLCCIGLLYNVV